MRCLIALVLLAAACPDSAGSAAAQTPDSAPVTRHRAALVAAGVVTGAAVTAATFVVLRAVRVPERDLGWASAAYPVGVVVGVHLAAQRLGLDGSLEKNIHGVLRGSLVGAAGGTLLGIAAFSAAGGLSGDGNDRAATLLFVAGVTFAALVPSYLASRGYHDPAVGAVVFVGPDGERAAGLSLRVGL